MWTFCCAPDLREKVFSLSRSTDISCSKGPIVLAFAELRDLLGRTTLSAKTGVCVCVCVCANSLQSCMILQLYGL